MDNTALQLTLQLLTFLNNKDQQRSLEVVKELLLIRPQIQFSTHQREIKDISQIDLDQLDVHQSIKELPFMKASQDREQRGNIQQRESQRDSSDYEENSNLVNSQQKVKNVVLYESDEEDQFSQTSEIRTENNAAEIRKLERLLYQSTKDKEKQLLKDKDRENEYQESNLIQKNQSEREINYQEQLKQSIEEVRQKLNHNIHQSNIDKAQRITELDQQSSAFQFSPYNLYQTQQQKKMQNFQAQLDKQLDIENKNQKKDQYRNKIVHQELAEKDFKQLRELQTKQSILDAWKQDSKQIMSEKSEETEKKFERFQQNEKYNISQMKDQLHSNLFKSSKEQLKESQLVQQQQENQEEIKDFSNMFDFQSSQLNQQANELKPDILSVNKLRGRQQDSFNSKQSLAQQKNLQFPNDNIQDNSKIGQVIYRKSLNQQLPEESSNDFSSKINMNRQFSYQGIQKSQHPYKEDLQIAQRVNQFLNPKDNINSSYTGKSLKLDEVSQFQSQEQKYDFQKNSQQQNLPGSSFTSYQRQLKSEVQIPSNANKLQSQGDYNYLVQKQRDNLNLQDSNNQKLQN